MIGQHSVTLTTDMWTSQSGESYFSLTAHYVTSGFGIKHSSLQCHHMPGTHDHSHLSSVIHLANGALFLPLLQGVPEHSPKEWKLLENLCKILETFKDATSHLSADQYPSLSALGSLLAQIWKKNLHLILRIVSL